MKFRDPMRAHALSEALARLLDKLRLACVSVMHVCENVRILAGF